MTIDEAIERCKNKSVLMNSKQAKEDWLQIASLLEELKELREDMEFFTFIANNMNPNEFQKYYEMFNAGDEKTNG